jgi:hypothetical protein
MVETSPSIYLNCAFHVLDSSFHLCLKFSDCSRNEEFCKDLRDGDFAPGINSWTILSQIPLSTQARGRPSEVVRWAIFLSNWFCLEVVHRVGAVHEAAGYVCPHDCDHDKDDRKWKQNECPMKNKAKERHRVSRLKDKESKKKQKGDARKLGRGSGQRVQVSGSAFDLGWGIFSWSSDVCDRTTMFWAAQRMSEMQGVVKADGARVRVHITSIGDAGVVTKMKIRFGYAQ